MNIDEPPHPLPGEQARGIAVRLDRSVHGQPDGHQQVHQRTGLPEKPEMRPEIKTEVEEYSNGGFHKWGYPKIDGIIMDNPAKMDE